MTGESGRPHPETVCLYAGHGHDRTSRVGGAADFPADEPQAGRNMPKAARDVAVRCRRPCIRRQLPRSKHGLRAFGRF